MDFDLPALLAQRAGQGYELQDRYLKPNLSRMLRVIGFDKVYERAEGSYLYDRDGNRYTDFLAGFGVFAMGRNHPVIRKALHDLLDSEVADLVQFDCALLPDGRIPLGDLDALARELRRGDVAGLLVEPIQGKGVHISPAGFLPAAADLLHSHGAVLICDEIQTGLGRTGRFFGYQHEDVQ